LITASYARREPKHLGVRVTDIDGIHHLAITTKDMKGQLDFFCNVLGGELRALYWMHGVEHTFHGFVRFNDSSYIAFVQPPAERVPEPVFGVSHAGSAAGPTARGAMQHVAFNVASFDDLLVMRDRIRSHGVPVLGPIDHGMCQSMYFAGPDNLSLEVATSAAAILAERWVDPEVVELCGIDAVQLAAFLHPAPPKPHDTPVAQPAYDPTKPHMVYDDPAMYQRVITVPDDIIWRIASETTPPVPAVTGLAG
jgi:catechol 2,3-dioxygenase-like lactoylglutathione lyase family enzyme